LLKDQAVYDQLPPTFTPADVAAAGVSRYTTYAWRDAGMIIELGRGVYRKANAPETAHLDLLAATKRAPRAIICLVSALAIHDLTDEIPPAVQLAVPRGVHPPQISYPVVEFSRFDPKTFELGQERFEAAPGEFVPVYSAERTLADCMRLRHRIGDAVAIRALRSYLSKHPNRAGDLMAVGRQLGDASALAKTIQVVLS
jgi:predicted transcriptional regulator of viral defense system